MVYDIAQCGPRNRFVVRGRDGQPLIVHNCGAAYTDASEVVEFDARPRLRVVEEVIEETARKVIIFAMFRSSMDALADHLTKKGYKVAQINGDVSASKRGQIIHTFQETDELDALILQAQATAHGITLTAADTASAVLRPLPSISSSVDTLSPCFTGTTSRRDSSGSPPDFGV